MAQQKPNITLSPLTLGTWVFGGTSWSGGDVQSAIHVTHAAIDAGIKYIDTAPIYSHGESERIIGRALKGKRDQVHIATKCGLKRATDGKTIIHDLSRSEILNQVEGSLRRLKTDRIDLYQCHAPDPDTNPEETMTTLLHLQKQGKIKAIGVSNFNPHQMEAFLKYGDIATSQDQYSLLDRDIEGELLSFTHNRNIRTLAYGSLAGGILTGKYTYQPSFGSADCRTFFYKHYSNKDTFTKAQRIIERLKVFGRPLNELAINWVRQQEGVSSVIVGCRDVKQLKSNLASLSWELSASELTEIKIIISE